MKHALHAALRARLEADLAAMHEAQRATVEGATHEEAKPEDDKDTRALEQSYLARGQAARVAELEAGVLKLSLLPVRAFGPDDRVALGALVTIEEDDAVVRYFLAPAGGGTKLDLDGVTVKVVTPESPLGRGLLGKSSGDDLELKIPKGLRELAIISVE